MVYNRKDLCDYCGRKDSAADKELRKRLKTVLPLCHTLCWKGEIEERTLAHPCCQTGPQGNTTEN